MDQQVTDGTRRIRDRASVFLAARHERAIEGLPEEDDMTGTLKPCKACGSEVKVSALDSFRGEEGSVAVRVDGMPALVCAQGHKRFLYPEFVARLIDLVADAEQVAPQPPALKRGLLRKRHHCSACDAELPAAASGNVERELEASFRNADSFKAMVRIALHKCAGCGREQVLSNDEVSEQALKALTHGFRAADIHVDR